MAKEKTVKVSIRVSESLYTELSDNADEEYRELAAHCRYLIVKFIEKYVTEKALDISFPMLIFKESSKTSSTILIRYNQSTSEIVEALMNQYKQKKSNMIRAILKHQIGYSDMADMPRLF